MGKAHPPGRKEEVGLVSEAIQTYRSWWGDERKRVAYAR